MYLENVFATVVNMTVTGSIVILCVLAARLCLKKAPRVFSYALWAVVLFRLLCPVSVSSGVSVLNLVDAPKPESTVSSVEYFPTTIVQEPLETMAAAGEGVTSVSTVQQGSAPIDWNAIGSRLWIVGVALLALYSVLSYVNLKRKLREAVPLEKGVREADAIASPFVLGILRPVIYLPSGLGVQEREYILTHEKFHVRHLDHVAKALFFAALCLHWFNPLVWLAFRLCGRDMEMRCDEAVLKKLGPQVRGDYAQSLLNLATGRRLAVCTPLAFGEGDTGKRVKNVLSWKRAAKWVFVPAAVLCAVVLAVTALNPNSDEWSGQLVFNTQYRAEAVLSPDGWPGHENKIYWFSQTPTIALDDNEVGLGGWQAKRLNGSFDLTDEDLEKTLRAENAAAWFLEEGSRWLLKQEDNSLYLTEGADTVLRLDRVSRVSAYTRQPENLRDTVAVRSGYRDSAAWEASELGGHMVDGEATLVFLVDTEEPTITVTEEYHRRLEDGSCAVETAAYTLEMTRDYGYELPVSRRGSVGDDYAIYRVDLGLSSYVLRLDFPAQPGVAEGQPQPGSRIAEFSDGVGYITMEIPAGWDYTVTESGICFWPEGYEAANIDLNYYPDGFGVCGTGLREEVITLSSGTQAYMGTYDNHSVWDYISFSHAADGGFAAIGEGHGRWWSQYGDEALEILASARMGEYVDMDAVTAYFRDFRLGDLGIGQVLRGEKDYQAVYYPGDGSIRLYEYAAYGETVEILNEWTGTVYADSCISVNLLEREGEYVYFGFLREKQGDADLTDGSFHFLLESGWPIDMILSEFDGFCFVCDSPMEDFRILDREGRQILDLAAYTALGYAVNPAR